MDKVGTSGAEEKADCRVEADLTPSKLGIDIETKVEKLYGKTIRKNVRKKLEEFGIDRGSIKIRDKGAYDFVIAARVEAALLKAGAEIESDFVDPSGERETNLRRTRLYLPGNNPKLLFYGTLFDCDCVILDLEDSVIEDSKMDARVLVRNMLHNLNYKQERMVRINPLPLGEEDIKEILKTDIDTLLIPKVETREELENVIAIIDEYESGYEKDTCIGVIPIIETALGLENAFEIALHERVTAMTFGAEDYLADVGGQRNKESLFYLRSRVLNAAKACGIQALDTVFPDINDEEGLEKEARMIRAMGFDGKGIIHPRQADVIHKVFTPSDDEYKRAKKIVDAFKKSEGEAVSVDGRMVDLPVAKRAQKTVSLYEGS
ncbi:MAG: aldolase/citrate lyase family protein [Euryarchaeota archaeon]|nr:aldolase/citrate lyase family protein [Euryarchaeota archaeon]